MNEVRIPLDEKLERRLWLLLNSSGGDGLIIKHMVALFEGLKVEVRANEHPPPHFHVRYNGEDASFTLDECKRLRGVRGLEDKEYLIREWWREHRRELAIFWNKTRPANCRVGTVPVPDER